MNDTVAKALAGELMPTVTLTIRIAPELVVELDRLVGVVTATAPPGARVTRTRLAAAALRLGVQGIASGVDAAPRLPPPVPPALELAVQGLEHKPDESQRDLMALLFNADGSRRMSASRLSLILGVSDSAVAHWRHGRHRMPDDAHRKIKALLKGRVR